MREFCFAQHEGAERLAIRLGLERATRPPQPRTGDRGARFHHVMLVEPHRALSRAHQITQRFVARIRLLAGGDALVETARATTTPRPRHRADRPRGAPRRRRRRARGRGPRTSPSGRAQRGPARCGLARGRLGCPSGRPPPPPQRSDVAATLQPGTAQPAASCLARCSSTGMISAVGLNSRNVTPSSVHPV